MNAGTLSVLLALWALQRGLTPAQADAARERLLEHYSHVPIEQPSGVMALLVQVEAEVTA